MVYSTQIQSKFAHPVGEPVPAFNTEFPAHPALVHFPIAFNTLAWALDILYALTTTVVRPDFLTSRFSDPDTLLDITRLSYFLLCAGLITTVPALMSGIGQLVGMVKKNGGPWEKDAAGKQKNTIVPRIQAAMTHAFLNDIVFVANLYSWYIRKDTASQGYVPSGVNLAISAVLLPIFLLGAKIGGSLVFNHGIGLNLGRKKVE